MRGLLRVGRGLADPLLARDMLVNGVEGVIGRARKNREHVELRFRVCMKVCRKVGYERNMIGIDMQKWMK